MFSLYLAEEFLEGIFLGISVSLIHLFYIEYKVWTKFIHELPKDLTILWIFITSDGVKHIAKGNEYSIVV